MARGKFLSVRHMVYVSYTQEFPPCHIRRGNEPLFLRLPTVPLRKKLAYTPVRTPVHLHVHTPVRYTVNACANTRAHTSTFYSERTCVDAYVFTCTPVVKHGYQMMMSYFKGTADAVAEYCSAVNCPNAPNTF